jgi:UDP-N-acetylglucosamine 2-epimerase (non-hydrolysing)
MAPVIRALTERPGLRQEVILTGQHGSVERALGKPLPPLRRLAVDLREQTAGEISEVLQHAISLALLRLRPDLVLVQGDTSSAVAGALAAADCGIAVAHVEAGLRSGDLRQPWPEEGNRIRIDRIAQLLFAPTAIAAARLSQERVTGDVLVTGNTGIDALFDARAALGEWSLHAERRTILVTCHRRENWGALPDVAVALERIARELPLRVDFVLHLNPQLRRTMIKLLEGRPNIALLAPVEHREMVRLMDRSWLILTDSGGIQEEGPALGKPVLVLRDVTERSEAMETDNIELVGTDPGRIFAAVRRLLDDEERYRRMSRPSFPFGDGHASQRIAAAIETFLQGRMPALQRMPTNISQALPDETRGGLKRP